MTNPETPQIQKDKQLLLGSLLVFIYFFSMYFLGAYRSDVVLIGVIIELATIPMLGLLVVLGVLTCIRMVRQRSNSVYTIISILLLTAVVLRFIF